MKLSYPMEQALVLAAEKQGWLPLSTHWRVIRALRERGLITEVGGGLNDAGQEEARRIRERRAREQEREKVASAPSPEVRAEKQLEAAVLADEVAARREIHAVELEARGSVGSVVCIHRAAGGRFRVKQLREERVGLHEAQVMALIEGCLPGGGSRWEVADILHVVPPAASVKTLPIGRGGVETLAEVPIAVEGLGWFEALGRFRQIATVRDSAQRLPRAVLLPWEGEALPVATLRVGDSVIVDGRMYRAAWDGDPTVEPRLVPENWHGFSE